MKKILKSPLGIGLETTLFGFLLSVFHDVLKQKNIFSTLIFVVRNIYKAVVWVLNFNIKILYLIIAIIVFWGIRYLYILKFKTTQELKNPKFLEYTEDIIKKWKWSWSWEQNYFDKKWSVNNLTPHCPKCDTHMIDSFMGNDYQCPRCGYRSLYDKCESKFEIEALIYDNIRRRYFSNKSN